MRRYRQLQLSPVKVSNQQRIGVRQAVAAESALAAARAQLEAAARDDISPSRSQAARQRIAALEAERARLQVAALSGAPLFSLQVASLFRGSHAVQVLLRRSHPGHSPCERQAGWRPARSRALPASSGLPGLIRQGGAHRVC